MTLSTQKLWGSSGLWKVHISHQGTIMINFYTFQFQRSFMCQLCESHCWKRDTSYKVFLSFFECWLSFQQALRSKKDWIFLKLLHLNVYKRVEILFEWLQFQRKACRVLSTLQHLELSPLTFTTSSLQLSVWFLFNFLSFIGFIFNSTARIFPLSFELLCSWCKRPFSLFLNWEIDYTNLIYLNLKAD